MRNSLSLRPFSRNNSLYEIPPFIGERGGTLYPHMPVFSRTLTVLLCFLGAFGFAVSLLARCFSWRRWRPLKLKNGEKMSEVQDGKKSTKQPIKHKEWKYPLHPGCQWKMVPGNHQKNNNTPSKLRVRLSKMMVGRWNLLLKWSLFRGYVHFQGVRHTNL